VTVPSILLIRHGQASFGSEDYDRLSPIGVRQAQLIARALVGRGVAPRHIVCGSLRRQVDTAAPAASGLDLTPQLDPRWNEYEMDEIIAAHHEPASAPLNLGHGLSASDFQDILENSLTRWMDGAGRTTAPESWPAFDARIQTALRELADSLEPSTTALVFTSGGVIATVCAGLLGLDSRQLLALNRVTVNTAVTKLAVGRRGLSLIAFNDHAHLEGTGLITYR
jgi:broad specificity phosphatase PhoE